MSPTAAITKYSNRVYRYLTAAKRALPNFIIVGTEKGGTTSLFFYLKHHPYLVAPLRKEMHYFSHHYQEGIHDERWYRSFFPLAEALNSGQSGSTPKQTYEGSTSYLSHPHVPERIQRLIPDVRLIAILRNPVERAYSQYRHQVRLGTETRSFEAAIEDERKQIDAELARIRSDEKYYSVFYHRFAYVARGQYLDQIKAYHAVFPREQLLILNSSDLERDPHTAFAQVLDHVGLPAFNLPETKRYNTDKNPEPMKSETRARLVEHFKPYNQALYAYLGRDFDWD